MTQPQPPKPKQALAPQLARAALTSKAAESATRSPSAFFSESASGNAKRTTTINGVVAPSPVLMTELQEAIKSRPSNSATPRKDN